VTRQRNDRHSTEFGLWLRSQPELDAQLHKLSATNLDFIWRNYATNQWMCIEEKRFMSALTFSQRQTLNFLKPVFAADPKFCGIHIVTFQKTSPDDGLIFLDENMEHEFSPLEERLITKEQLIRLLQFRTIR